MFRHFTPHNLKRNGRRVHVLLHSKSQLCLISVIAFLVFNVFGAHLHQAKSDRRDYATTCNNNPIHKQIWNTTQNTEITYIPGSCQQLKHSTLSHCTQSDCFQHSLLSYGMEQCVAFSTHSSASSESKSWNNQMMSKG